ncbi:MAG: murein biosynthesis integral membrane protein MurJ [Candidatus Nealsonbacteria bacterium]|nr:murein biosynthesis integral membrane protein MurJ [Candidatus Nealsonbacteria bacterium]
MRIFSFFNQPTQNISLSAAILALSTLLSALLGIWRDRLLASSFGAGRTLDIYVASFRIPDLVYNLLVAGVLAVAVLPVFAEAFQKDKEKAWRVINNFFNLFLLTLLVTCFIFFLLTPWLIKFVVPGFDIAEIQQTIWLTRLLFLSSIFFGGVGLFSGLLQYFNKFIVLALSPLIYNLFIILGILFLSPRFGIFGVGLGVVLGAFVYFCLQLYSCVSCGWHWQRILDWKDPGIKRVFRLMLPRFFSAASQQINLLITTGIASTLGLGALAIFYFSNNLQSFVTSFVGVSLATAAFQALSKAAAREDRSGLLSNLSLTFRKILFWSLFLSFFLIVFKEPIVRILLGSGKFSPEAIQLTAAALGLFSVSIFAQAEIPLLLRAFFALQEAVRPTVIAVVSMLANILLSFGLVQWLTVDPRPREILSSFLGNLNPEALGFALLGLPLAFSLATIFQFGLLCYFLRDKFKLLDSHESRI